MRRFEITHVFYDAEITSQVLQQNEGASSYCRGDREPR